MKKGVNVDNKQPQKPFKNPNKTKSQGARGALTALGITTTIGTELGITTALGFYLGRYLDNKLDTTPIFLVIGILFGLGIGIAAIITTLNTFFKNKNEGVK